MLSCFIRSESKSFWKWLPLFDRVFKTLASWVSKILSTVWLSQHPKYVKSPASLVLSIHRLFELEMSIWEIFSPAQNSGLNDWYTSAYRLVLNT